MNNTEKIDLAMWADMNGDFILIGDENCQVGDPIISIPLNQESVLAWIKALVLILEDREIINLPGDIGECTKVS